MRTFYLLVIFFITLQASQAFLRKNKAFAMQNGCSIYTISNVNWPNVYIRMEQSQTYGSVNIVDLHRTSSPDVKDQWKVYIYQANNQWGYYVCLKNVYTNLYMSLDSSRCPGYQVASGCGKVGIAANCYGNEQFVFPQVSNGHAALVSVANPHYLLRSDGGSIYITTVKQPDPSVYSAGAKLPQQEGGGVFNAQYYDDYTAASTWESYDAHLVDTNCG